MSVGATEFYSTLFAYLAALIIPILIIKSVSKGLGSIRNRFDILSALIIYPIVFIASPYATESADLVIGKSILSLYIGFAITIIACYIMLRAIKATLTS